MPDPSATTIASAGDLRRSFGERVAVDGVSFEIAAGETFGLLGPNGAGKSTTISILCGLLAPDSGRVEVDGIEISPGSTTGRGAIGLVPQDLAVYPDLTGAENLHFFATLQGMSRAGRTERANQVLDIIGLSDRRDDRVSTYSGGMKRRLNIGIGLLHRPRLLVLDEPTVGVDPQSRNAILESVEQLSDGGIAVLYTTHYMEEAERLCDRIAIMDRGRVLAEGSRQELLDSVSDQELVRIDLEREAEAERAAQALASLPEVREIEVDQGSVRATATQASTQVGPIVAAVVAAGCGVLGVGVDRPDLETVFLRLTGRGLRD